MLYMMDILVIRSGLGLAKVPMVLDLSNVDQDAAIPTTVDVDCECMGKHFPIKCSPISAVKYFHGETADLPKIDIWEITNRLRDNKIIDSEDTVCGLQPAVAFIEGRGAIRAPSI